MHTDYFRIIHPWTIYASGKPLATFLSLAEALESLFLFLKTGRRVYLTRTRG